LTDVTRPPVRRPYVTVALRTAEISIVCAAHAVRWALAPLAVWRRDSVLTTPARAARLLEDLGPTFVKIGQVLSARPDLVPAEWCSALGRLREQVRPIPPRVLQRRLDEIFGPARDAFAWIDPEPVAAGSIAQVHRAALAGGRVVALKIRRPGVERRVHADFAVLRAVTRVLARLPFMRWTPVREIAEEVAAPVCEQLDFRLEAENHREIARMLEREEGLKVPRLVEPLCSDDVLAMEFIDGLRDVTTASVPASQRQHAALTGLRALYRMIFLGGLVHADLHPGNFFVREWGTVVLLDMGLTARLAPADRTAFVDFFFGMINGDGDECARIVVEGASALGPRFQRDRFEREMRALVARHARRRSREFEVGVFVTELIALQRRYDVRGSTAFMTTVLALVVYESVCKQLYPECDFQAEARGFLVLARYSRAGAPVSAA